MKWCRSGVIGVALALSMPALHAATWVEVAQGTKSKIYIDVDSVAPSGRYWKAWDKTEYDEPQETTKFPKKTYTHSKSLTVYNCAEKTAMVTSWLAYDSSGDVVEQESAPITPASFNERVPETIGERMSSELCRYVASLSKKQAKSK